MTPESVLSVATTVTLVILSLALLLTVVRIVRGPTLGDRVLGLDLLVVVAIGLIAAIAIRTGFSLYIDIALALCLAGFVATVAFARYIAVRGPASEAGQPNKDAPKTGRQRGAKPAPAKRRKRR